MMEPEKRMPHVGENLSAYLSGELTESERRQVEEHIADCSECLRELQVLEKVDGLISSVPDLDPPENFTATVMSLLDYERKVRRLSRTAAAVLVMAAVIAFFVFLVPSQQEQPATPELTKKEEPVLPRSEETKPELDNPVPNLPAEEVELIANLDALEDMELIQESDELEEVELYLLMNESEETR